MTTTTLTLLELNTLVRQVIEGAFDREYWVEAELSECRVNRGHCFMELIQKDEHSNTPIARASAKCWQSTWAVLQPQFEEATHQTIHAGMKLRLKVYAQFHEIYGFSWIVTGIDPTFTLGDMARRRMEIIRQLKEEGIFDLQKELQLPLFCLNIAVISSATAAGYGDFVNQLADSPYNFHTQLFPATMQGEQVEQSIIKALNDIFRNHEPHESHKTHESYESHKSYDPPFDCVVIIRGGGATADLSGFDTLLLAENVAQFPLPIITGIGHDRDESILDMVSHTRVKTPTAAAQLLISHLDNTQRRIDNCQDRLTNYAQSKIETEQLRLARLSEHIPTLFSVIKTRQEARLDHCWQALTAQASRLLITQKATIENLSVHLPTAATHLLEKEQHLLEMLQQRARALDPAILLKRGYSITLHQGKALRNPSAIKPGDEIETCLEKGIIKSIVT